MTNKTIFLVYYLKNLKKKKKKKQEMITALANYASFLSIN